MKEKKRERVESPDVFWSCNIQRLFPDDDLRFEGRAKKFSNLVQFS